METMYYPDKKEFIGLCGQGNVIPVYHEILADFDTPLSAFLKIDKGDCSFLLESVEDAEKLGRYSFLGSDPLLTIRSKGDKVTVTKKGVEKVFTIDKDPIDELRKVMKDFKFVTNEKLPRFCGGLVGYIGYDMVRYFENIPDDNPGEIDLPDMRFDLADTMLVFDHVDRKIKIVALAFLEDDPEKAYEDACVRIKNVMGSLKRHVNIPEVKISSGDPGRERSNFTDKEFHGIVEKAKEHIKAGDIIQVVLSQRLERETKADPFSVYRALRSINPSPYMYYLKYGEHRIVGSSPEILVRCEDGVVEVRPIAGTRRRGKDREEDLSMEKELLGDPKERAEHIMLVDLGRNDIGRVCDYSSVRPRELMRIERYSHVMHIVSDIAGELRDDKDIYDVIRATFPAGTVTGAPKVKAMELIDKFENTRRGPYAGCVGYIGFSGNIDLCITIRTIVMAGNKAYIQAGAGIVLDSDPVLEYKETLNKAGAMIKAIEFAEKGLQ